MGPPSTHQGTILLPLRIPQGSLKGQTWAQLGTILVPPLIHYGSLMGPSWTHLGTPWFPRGSLRDHRTVTFGPSLEPAWFLFDPSWILCGSNLTDIGTALFPRGSLRDHSRVNSWTQLRVGPYWKPSGSPRIHIGTVVGHSFAPIKLYWTLVGPTLVPRRDLNGSVLDPLEKFRNRRGSFKDPPWARLGPNLELVWFLIGFILF